MNQSKNDEEMLATGETSAAEDSKPEENKPVEKSVSVQISRPIESEILKFSDFTEGESCEIGCCTKKCQNFSSEGFDSGKIIRCGLQNAQVVPRVVCLPWLRSVQDASSKAQAQIKGWDNEIVLLRQGKASLEAKMKIREDVYHKDGIIVRGENTKLKKTIKEVNDKLEELEKDVIQGEDTISFLGNKLMELQEFVREKSKYEKVLESKNNEIEKIKPRLQIAEKENGRLMVEDRAKDARISSLEKKIKILADMLSQKDKEDVKPRNVLTSKEPLVQNSEVSV